MSFVALPEPRIAHCPHILLIPTPKALELTSSHWTIPSRGEIILPTSLASDSPLAVLLRAHLQQLEHEFICHNASPSPVPHTAQIHFRLTDNVKHPQAYILRISSVGADAQASTEQGLFYAAQTLVQLLRQHKSVLPGLIVHDEPDFNHRGFMLDVSRGRVPTMQTLKGLIDDLAALKINEFQLYIENVFAFQNHPDIYSDTTPLSAAEMRELDQYCRNRYIQFVPCLASLGHMDKILRRPKYRHLAEVEADELRSQGITPWCEDPWSLCVTDPLSRSFLTELYQEFLPNFSASVVNVCCDETWDLGKGRSRSQADAIGIGRLYLHWICFCSELARRYDKAIQLWGDIIISHPSLIAELPTNTTLLEWGYESDHPFAEHARQFAASGRPFYVCPGTSTWQSLTGRTENAMANMHNAALAGMANHAIGYLITDWGDYGHLQPLAISLLPLAYAAAVSWHTQTQANTEFYQAVSMHVFQSKSLDFAQWLADAGNIYQHVATGRIRNASLEHWLWREPWDQHKYLSQTDASHVQDAVSILRPLTDRIAGDHLNRPDARDVHCELAMMLDIAMLALSDAQARLAAATPSETFARHQQNLYKVAREEYRSLWLRRNGQSRLEDMLRLFDQRISEYAGFSRHAGKIK
ncbi:MAG: family 20 glycosylhydrolase [Phycisphaerales bacterium]|nr:family 20 glycosylhydrolase [Phycisphaerales bacterium]